VTRRHRPHWPGRRVKAVKGWHQPTRDEPLIAVIIDEVQDAGDIPEIRDLVRRICADHLRQRWI
jgi:hypothetical protein